MSNQPPKPYHSKESGIAVAAVDLGASSGRVMVGRVAGGKAELVEAHRFSNNPVQVRGVLHWNILGLFEGVRDGLRAAGRMATELASVGVDSWAVDFGLLDEAGQLVGNPVHYRDGRTDGVAAKVHTAIPPTELYQVTGLQELPFNTIYQLLAAADTPAFGQARTMLLIPDLLTYWLTGEIGAEVTNASTTQLFDIRRKTWASDLIERLRLPAALFPQLREPGSLAGRLLPDVAEQAGLSQRVPVTAVGSHDTASAVVAVPALQRRFAYVSCGTWSLVGVELDRPVLSEDSRLANFTNELGVDGRIRYLRNVMGLWLLQESLRVWRDAGLSDDLAPLLAEAAHRPGLAAVIDVDDPAFLPPGDMPARITQACKRNDQPAPADPPATVRCVLDSLALAYRRTVRQAQELSGQDVDVLHIVGGGARNALLCQLAADATRLPVLAGPVEATALGNVLIQARAMGAAPHELEGLRALVASSQPLTRYTPTGDESAWEAAERRLRPSGEY